MKPQGFEAVQKALGEGYEVWPQPKDGEDKRFVGITFRDTTPHEEVLNLLDEQGFMYDGRFPARRPALEFLDALAGKLVFVDRAHEIAPRQQDTRVVPVQSSALAG